LVEDNSKFLRTYDPLFFDVWISGLEGVCFGLGFALDRKVETASVEPRHFFVFLTNRSLNVGHDGRC
jgi:hypothetical protein